MFESVDGAKHWAPKNTGLPLSPLVLEIAFDPSNSQVIYVGLVQNGVYRSTNGSDTWSDFNTGIPNDPASLKMNSIAVASDGNTVYAASDAGVYVRPT